MTMGMRFSPGPLSPSDHRRNPDRGLPASTRRASGRSVGVVLLGPTEAPRSDVAADRESDLTADALAHWLELGVARGADELTRRLGRTIDLEPRAVEPGPATSLSSHWIQTFQGDVAGRVMVSVGPLARRRLDAASSAMFSVPRESAPELELQIWNIVLNEVLLTLQGALDLALRSSLPVRSQGPLEEAAPVAVVPFTVGLSEAQVEAELRLELSGPGRSRFEEQLQRSLARYLDSFTTWTPL